MSTVLKLPIRLDTIGSIPYAFGLFNIALKNPQKSANKLIEYIGEKLSLNIYILHTLLDDIIGLIIGNIFVYDISFFIFNWCRPIIVLIVSIAVSLIIYIGRNVKAPTRSSLL